MSPTAIQALQDALALVYWYKNDLKKSLRAAIGVELVGRLNWESPKRQIVSDLVDELCRDQEKYLGELRLLLKEVSEFRDFTHLERIEDSAKKIKEAKDSVRRLRELVSDHDAKVREEAETTKLRQAAIARSTNQKALSVGLQELRAKYTQLVMDTSVQRRGFALEKVICELFRLFDLDPKASFRITGEQIDGAFSLQGLNYLFESKWAGLVAAKEMDVFAGKVQRKLDNTLGLMLSIDGFQPDGITAHSKQRPVLILMTGADLMAVFEGRMEIGQMLLLKRRHASHTGEILLEFSKM